MNSTNEQLRAAAGVTQPAQSVAPKEKTFPQMLEAYKSQIAAALPAHISPDRMCRIALTAFRQNPQLAVCEPRSIFAAVVLSAQLGLEVGILGQAYLVPYRNQDTGVSTAQFIPGWQGLCDLVQRSGRASVWTGAVYEGDEFEYEFGTAPAIKHKPAIDPKAGAPLLYCYAVGRVRGAEYPVIEVWSRQKLEKHRDSFNRVGKKHYSFKNFEMYGRKVPLMQVLKYMPKSIELSQAVMAEYMADSGSTIDLKEAIDGSFQAPPPVQEIESEQQQT